MKRIIGITFIIFAVALFSCQNDKVDIPVDDTMAEKSAQITLTEVKLEAVATETEYEVEFYANAEEMLTRWWKMGKMWRWTNRLRYQMNHCPDVAIENGEENGYPKTITLDYGEGTILKNEKVLSGIIEIVISAPKKSKDYTRTVSYDNFGVDTIMIEGYSEVIVDKDDSTFRYHNSSLNYIINDETTVMRTSNRTWMWIEGMETMEDQTDDVIHIEGIVNATKGEDSYKKEIVEVLVKLGDCRFIVAGIVEISLNETVIATMNYGDGTCDEVATMTNDTETVEVDLKQHKMKGKQKQNGNG